MSAPCFALQLFMHMAGTVSDGCSAQQARKAGQIEEDGADKQDLHKFADRVHTVLRNPIDTSLLGKVKSALWIEASQNISLPVVC